MRQITRNFVWGLTLFILGFFLLIINAYTLLFGELDNWLAFLVLSVFQILSLLMVFIGGKVVNKTL